MLRVFVILAIVLTGCREEPAPTRGRLGDVLQSNAKLVGYLYSADQPYVLVAFQNGTLQWRSDPQRKASTEGQTRAFSLPNKVCLGFERKALSMPTHGPERYLVCEATEAFEHRNHLPRSQDFSFKRGDLFLEYQPPEGTGFPQIYYAGAQK